ncbi:unnamed protein product [Anisakis simplex]|uniref:SSD domain-containing protein n=1 Tax=Anisakis simplex TaxID=6269 RepID=A0A158PP72_ANISI|nr:unnamed protein product [Anisakis simplex]
MYICFFQLLDGLTNDVYLYNSFDNTSSSFAQFCTSFCTINEPLRQFYKGSLVNSYYNDTASTINLGYPSTTVLGRTFHMDTMFFGVQIEITDGNGNIKRTSIDQLRTINGLSILDDEQMQVPNNVKDVRMIILQLRAQKPIGATKQDVENYEMQIVRYPKINFTTTSTDVVIMSPTFLKSEVVRNGLRLLPFTFSGFFIMCIFSSTTATISALYMSQMNFNKIILAIAACVCPFMACGTALGTLFWAGVRFGSILCVTPFLVLAIGVDDAFLMIHSWQRNNRRLKLFPESDQQGKLVITDVSKRMGSMLEDIGPSVTITTMTNVLAFAIGALTPTPEIRLFCIGNAAAMLIDFIYQLTFFGSVLAVITRRELEHEKEELKEKPVERKFSTSSYFSKFSLSRANMKNYMNKYCAFICNKFVSLLILGTLVIYWIISIYGILTMKAELKPGHLFSDDSDMMKIIDHRKKYITPYYTLCYVFAEDFERLPRSVGRFSTKFWLRDYEQFVEFDDVESDVQEEALSSMNSTSATANITLTASKDVRAARTNELTKFLEWPEFRYWKGFMHYHINARGEAIVDKFFFTTAAHGRELNEWSKRTTLMQQWRSIVDRYADLAVSVYDDDAKFLDLIGTMASQTIQSSIYTLICMILVCLLFIKRISAVVTATLSITSTCIGGVTVVSRLQHCLADITFPILQAAASTLICLLTLLFVPIHMSIVFVKTMVLVVTIGLIHGLIVIPVFFNVVSWFTSLLRLAVTFNNGDNISFNNNNVSASSSRKTAITQASICSAKSNREQNLNVFSNVSKN